MPNPIEIAPFAPRYAAQASSLILSIQREEFGIPITLDDQPDLRDIPGFYQRNAGNFWLALAADAVVGTIGLLDIGHGEGVLRKMFVAAAWRGRERGVSASLLAGLLDHARSQGLRAVTLGTIDKYHAALRFYAKNGFSPLSPEALPSGFPRMAVDNRFFRIEFQACGR